MRLTLLSLFGFLSACGGTRAPDLAAWDAEVNALRARVSEYKTQAPAAASSTSCHPELDRYKGDVGPRLQRMRAMSGGMDDCMNAMGHQNEADLSKVCADMDAELERYASEGCRSGDAQNRADAEAHADQMLGSLDRSAMRSQSMNG